MLDGAGGRSAAPSRAADGRGGAMIAGGTPEGVRASRETGS
jgi:hypothetical protein